MKIFGKNFNLFEKKSDSIFESDALASLIYGVSSGVPINIPPRMAYNHSEKNDAVGTSVQKISGAIASFNFGIKDINKEIRFEDPLLDLLHSPGDGMRSSQFWNFIIESFLLTQEIWIVARGNINREPLSIVPIRPYDVNVIFNKSDGIPDEIHTQCDKDRRVYKRIEEMGKIRYIDTRSNLNEIFPIIGVTSTIDDWRGRCPLVKLYYDIAMGTEGKRHNTSLLKNGMRTTGILTPKQETGTGQQAKWDVSTVEMIEKHIRAFNQGAGNAGNVFILGTPADLQGITQSNKEMDFIELLKNSKVAIYNLFSIPLPLVLAETMTLDNYTVANRAFYTNAVYPVFEDVANGIMFTIGSRFKSINERDKLTFSEVEIRNMQPVLVENMRMLKETESVKIDEIRSVGGYESTPGGDVVLISSAKIPLDMVSLSVTNSFEQFEKPEDQPEEDAQEETEQMTEDEGTVNEPGSTES